ncbi:MAG: DUF418 domain-containing protein [Sphingomonas bacterium]|nr:DUF418 domain-containing protein [Sphingomonas bacterium]
MAHIHAEPLAPQQRADLLDALRGFALFGVLASNMVGFSGSLYAHVDLSTAATLTEFGLDWLMHGKFYSIFSMLFGIGFALQIERLEARGEGIGRYMRRLWILFGFGILHIVLLWKGDILALYALMGFMLLLFRGVDDRTLLRWAVLLALAPILWRLAMVWTSFEPRRPLHDVARAIYAAFEIDAVNKLPGPVSTGPHYLEHLKMGIGGPFQRAGGLLQELRPARVLAMFMVGLWIGRHALYARLDENVPLLRKVVRWGLAIGLPASAAMAWIIQFGAEGELRDLWEATAYSFGVPTLALAYAAGFALLWRGAARRWLTVFAPAGRMALTNYITQTLIQALLFMGWGLGLLGQMSIVWVPLAAVALFAAQVALSALWLNRFRFGPLEWLWRSLTYGAAQSMRHAPMTGLKAAS